VSASISASYSDLYAYYTVWPGNIIVQGDDAVNESVRNILSVFQGSLIFDRRFGSGLIKELHEIINDQSATTIRMLTIMAIDTYEPRVATIPGYCYVTPLYDLNAYQLSIGYRIKETGAVNTYTFRLQGAA